MPVIILPNLRNDLFPILKFKIQKTQKNMKKYRIVALNSAAFRLSGLGVLLLWTPMMNAETVLSSGHTDVGIVYEDDAWNLHIGQHEATPPAEYAPSEAILQVGPASQTTIPANSAFSFLGAAGSPIYVLPEVQNNALLFLGFGTEELASGLFLNDEVTMSLQAVRGPGQFSVYDVDPFGNPTVLMNSGDGIAANDSVILAAGGHRHVNWAFSDPGTYQIDFEASGSLTEANQFTSSGPVTYTFEVVPEPGTATLLALGGLSYLALTLRRRLQR